MQAEYVIHHAWTPDRATPMRWVLSHLRRHWVFFVLIVVGALGNAYGAALVPWYIGQAFNAVALATPDFDIIGRAAILIIVSQLLRAVLQFVRNFSSDIVGQRLERDLRDELYSSLIGKPMSFHDRQSIGDVMARCTNDVRELNYFMSPGVNITLGSGSFIIFVTATAPAIHPLLIVVPLSYSVVYFVLVVRYLRDLSRVADRARAAFGRLNTVLAESVEGVETVKAYAQEPREQARFEKELESWRTAAVEQGRVESRFLPGLLLGLTMASGLVLSFYLFAQGQISVGGVVAFNGLLMQLQFPTFASQFAYPQLASGMAGARRMLELVNSGAPAEDAQAGPAPDSRAETAGEVMRGEVEFRNVTFCYADEDCGGAITPAIADISFRVPAGSTIAIVGQTGAGKSTITKLINRIYDPDSGTILIDGKDARGWELANLRRQVSVIEQDVFLFSRSIAENIAFGVPNASMDDVVRAAQAAQAHDFISTFKDGYDTPVGERGVTLSGGQRQRIAIARAFLTDPRILLLDDATSAIDSATEDQIQRAMLRAAQGRTTFFITHRLSQIRWADMVVVLDRGRLAGVGTHETLMRTSAAYREIFT